MSIVLWKGANAANSRLSGGVGSNLIVQGKSDFEDGTSTWAANASTVVNSAVRAHGGTRSMQVTANGVGPTLCILTAANYGGNLDANGTYLLEGWLWLDATWDGGLTWLMMQGYLGSSAVEVKTDVTGSWQKVSARVTLASDVSGQLYIRSTSTPSNTKVMYLDDVTLRKVL